MNENLIQKYKPEHEKFKKEKRGNWKLILFFMFLPFIILYSFFKVGVNQVKDNQKLKRKLKENDRWGKENLQ